MCLWRNSVKDKRMKPGGSSRSPCKRALKVGRTLMAKTTYRNLVHRVTPLIIFIFFCPGEVGGETGGIMAQAESAALPYNPVSFALCIYILF